MVETANPFAGDGVWLRCALHAHTTRSDGELSPEHLARHYDWAGFDVLATTDHWVRTAEPSRDGLLVIPSCELNARAGGPDDDAHVLALGVEADPEPPGSWEFPSLPDTVAWIVEHGGVPYVAHPYWSGLRTAQFEDCPGLVGLEIWNAGCELELGRGDSTVHWDEALERGRLLYGIAADDSHHPGFDSGFAATWVRAAESSPEAVLEALRTGRCYGSAGPEIRALELGDDAVVVATSPVASVTLYTGRRSGARVNAGRLGYPYQARILERSDDGLITAAELRRLASAPYGRIEIADPVGRRAWTNPLWIGEGG